VGPLWAAGAAHGVIAAGWGLCHDRSAGEGLSRHGAELELDFDLVEAGMVRPTVKAQDFLGKAAYLDQRSRPRSPSCAR